MIEKNVNNLYQETFTNSAEFGVINQRDFFDKDISNKANLAGYYVVQNNDFVYNPRISNFAPVGPIKRNKLGRSGVMSPLYHVFRVEGVDYQFLETYFENTQWHIFMKENGDSGARSDRFAIKDSVFFKMPISLPSKQEQTAISDFFRQLDAAIASHQRKPVLQKASKIKQADTISACFWLAKSSQMPHHNIGILIFKFLNNMNISVLRGGHARMPEPSGHAGNRYASKKQ